MYTVYLSAAFVVCLPPSGQKQMKAALNKFVFRPVFFLITWQIQKNKEAPIGIFSYLSKMLHKVFYALTFFFSKYG